MFSVTLSIRITSSFDDSHSVLTKQVDLQALPRVNDNELVMTGSKVVDELVGGLLVERIVHHADTGQILIDFGDLMMDSLNESTRVVKGLTSNGWAIS